MDEVSIPIDSSEISLNVEFLASWIVVSTCCAVALNYLTRFYVIVCAFVAFLSCSLCAAITIGMSVTLYPTHVRATAACFIYMFGRIGGLIGTNLVAVLIEHSCTMIFYIYAVILISKQKKQN